MSSVIFLETPNFGSTVLQGLIDQGCDVRAAVTQSDKRVEHKQAVHQSVVRQTALKYNLPAYQPAKLSGSGEPAELIKVEPDFIITTAYGQFLPTEFLKSTKVVPVNAHGSLLPKYRGGAPIQYSILNGDKEAGITIMEMVKKMDAGDIFSQEALPIEADNTSGILFDKLSTLSRDLLLETLPKFIDRTVTRTPQDEAKVVFSPNTSKEQEQIKLSMTTEQVNNPTRALSPDLGAYLMFDGKRFKIWKAKPLIEETSLPTRALVINKKRFIISMVNGSELRLLEVQPAGEKKMNIKDYLSGQGSHFISGEKVIDE